METPGSATLFSETTARAVSVATRRNPAIERELGRMKRKLETAAIAVDFQKISQLLRPEEGDTAPPQNEIS